ncbi:MAG TPA: hypothetical protein VF263_22995 [Longimicrobiaceae bacterium]
MSAPRRGLAERLYALLLRAYPAAFRREFGAEMLQLFRDRRRAGEPPLRLWLHLLADFAFSVPPQHLATLKEDPMLVARRLVGIALILLAAVHFAIDLTHPGMGMGWLMILLMVLSLAAGVALLLVRPRKPA